MPLLNRMGEAEQPGMQSLTRKGGNPRARRASPSNGSSGARAVDRIADQGVAEMGEMNPDLMSPTRGKTALNKRRMAVERALDPIAGDRWLSASFLDDGHFFAVRGAAADIAGDLTHRGSRYAPNKGNIRAIHSARGEITR